MFPMQTIRFFAWGTVLLFFFTASAMEARLLLSPVQHVYDQFRFLPKSCMPFVPVVKRTTPGQELFLYLILSEIPQNSGRALVSGDLSVKMPSGEEKKLTSGACFYSGPGGKGTFLSPLVLRAVLKKEDAPGRYEYRIALFSQGEKPQTVCASCELQIPPQEKRKMMEEEWLSFTEEYFLHPAPERLEAAFDYFLAHNDAWRRERQETYHGNAYLCGFAAVLRLNGQLKSRFAAKSTELSDQGRRALAAVLVQAGEEFSTGLEGEADSYTLKMVQEYRKSSPLALQPVRHPWQLEGLWREFFVTGRVELLLRIVNEMRKRPELLPQAAVSLAQINGGTLPEGEREKLMNCVLHSAAEVSLAENLKKNRIVRGYLETLSSRNLIPDPQAADIVRKLLAAPQKGAADRDK